AQPSHRLPTRSSIPLPTSEVQPCRQPSVALRHNAGRKRHKGVGWKWLHLELRTQRSTNVPYGFNRPNKFWITVTARDTAHRRRETEPPSSKAWPKRRRRTHASAGPSPHVPARQRVACRHAHQIQVAAAPADTHQRAVTTKQRATEQPRSSSCEGREQLHRCQSSHHG
uniref:Uncharacterized protein n=1 Tax=Aegilops tauschii subsp. strangulata TaxID=200361 RepID=A0A453MPH5_AEGTS